MSTVGFLAGWALRSSILIVCGAVLMKVLRVTDPAVRLAAWTAMLCGSLAIPILTASLPAMAHTVTSAVPEPAVIVTFPAARAVSTGGSSVDRLTTAGLLDIHVSPVTGWLEAFIACSDWVVSPTTIFKTLGTTVLLLPGTANGVELLHTPFC
jgi:hypothetical protein